ncbi:MAG: OmpA family protein [Bacteroidota bacterium]
MKRIILTGLFAAFFMIQLSLGQSPDRKNAFSYQVSILDYYSTFSENYLDAEGFQSLTAKLAYHRNLAGPLNLEIPFRIGSARLPVPDNALREVANSKLLTNIDALLQLQFFRENNLFVPYLSAGIGGTFIEDQDLDFQIPLGLGLDFRLVEGVYLQGRSEYRISTADLEGIDKNQNNFAHNIGLKIFLGKGEEKPEEPIDSDGDGISDLLDQCPDQTGTKELMGCPDGDGDGIADKDDNCPAVAGEAAFNGCPDTDGDTVPDSEDKCPDVAGLSKFSGCPDTDKDGIEDAQDACPNVYGVEYLKGCPDSDRDGVGDATDKCPDVAGLEQFNGCPDTDRDGIMDSEDDCPEEAGKIENRGCPVKEISEADKETLAFAAKNIQFESNSSYLKTGSSNILDQVADILQRYPDYNVNIDGYTDNVGKDSYNQWLSEKRAERCYNYLADKGIATSRMQYKGYGEENPIADNNTAAGRVLNRRVEFNLYLAN